ncbi:MAG: hypothetical protein HYT41_00065 [Candidatus Sungbacteria bacterium]|nr:hypothetical protein [Candidatus Sungbacteria bacterium]
MQQQRRSPSVRKFLRREKARIRREVPDQKEAESKIREISASLHAA